MAKAVIFSDIHCSLIKGNDLFVETPLLCIDEMLKYAKKNKIEYVWFLGDFFHKKEVVEAFLLPRIKPTMKKFADFKSTFIVGNHDLVFRENSSYNLLTLFDEYMEIVPDPYLVKNIDGNNFTFCNYTSNGIIADEEIPIDESTNNVLLGHIECNGFYANAGYEMKNGSVNLSDMRMFDLIVSGHFHFRTKRGSMQYVGATHHQRRNDVGNPFGFMVLDLKTLDYTFETFGTYEPPCYYQYDITDLKKIKKTKNGFLRINITEDGDDINSAVLIDLKKYLKEKMGNRKVDFVPVKKDKDIDVDDGEGLIDEMEDMDGDTVAELEDIFDVYLESVKTDLDKKRLMKKIKG